MFSRLKKTYNDFPRIYWIVIVSFFIDGIGSTLLFPFFALYVTQRFGIGMTEAGVLLGMSSLFGMLGNVIGGAITDRFGRRRLILIGLVFSALSSLSLGLARDVRSLYYLIIIVGLLSRIAIPAYDAMMADILPEAKRQEGFGISRIVYNFAWIFGPALGGLIATRSFFALFVIDAILSTIVALIFYRFLPETKPAAHEEKKQESLLKTMAGYRVVLRDLAFLAFAITGIIAVLVYQQLNSSLPIYLRDVHGISSRNYGVMLSLTGLEVVLFQFWISRAIRRRPPFLMVMLGALFFMLGFTMFGLVKGFPLFILAITIVTIGEMIFFPTSQVLAAGFAPEDMRGRYMALYGLAWSIPATIGPGAAGLILDNYNPNLLWYISGMLCVIAAAGFYVMQSRLGTQKRFAPAQPEDDASALS
jgi:MFS family permease